MKRFSSVHVRFLFLVYLLLTAAGSVVYLLLKTQ
jgi:hypothetical protein